MLRDHQYQRTNPGAQRRPSHTERPPQNTEMYTNIIETCHTHSQQQKHKIPERHLAKEHTDMHKTRNSHRHPGAGGPPPSCTGPNRIFTHQLH